MIFKFFLLNIQRVMMLILALLLSFWMLLALQSNAKAVAKINVGSNINNYIVPKIKLNNVNKISAFKRLGKPLWGISSNNKTKYIDAKGQPVAKLTKSEAKKIANKIANFKQLTEAKLTRKKPATIAEFNNVNSVYYIKALNKKDYPADIYIHPYSGEIFVEKLQNNSWHARFSNIAMKTINKYNLYGLLLTVSIVFILISFLLFAYSRKVKN